MSMNRIPFQEGLSLPEFQSLNDTDEQCEADLEKTRWPGGYQHSRCQCSTSDVHHARATKHFQCRVRNHQPSPTAGDLFDNTKLPLITSSLPIYRVNQSKNTLSILSLKRQLGIC